MLVLDRILAIPDYEPDAIQMGLSTHNRSVLRARGYKRTDGIEAKDRFIKADKWKEAIKLFAIIVNLKTIFIM